MSTKVGAAALGAALATILVWAIKQFGAVEIPDPVTAAIALVIGALLGYIVPEENPSPSMVTAVRANKGAAKTRS